MREVIGVIGGITIAEFALYFFLPALTLTKAGESALLNSTDPTIALSQNLGGGFYSVLPFIPIIVGVFLIISFALRRDILE